MVFGRTSCYHSLLGLSSQLPDLPEKTASCKVSLCHAPRPSPNPVSQEITTAFITIAGCLFTSRLENLIFNKSNRKEVLFMRVSGDDDLLLLLLFPAQMVLQMKWRRNWIFFVAGDRQVQTWPLQWDLIRHTAHHRLRSFSQTRVFCGNSENCQVNNWPLIWYL